MPTFSYAHRGGAFHEITGSGREKRDFTRRRLTTWTTRVYQTYDRTAAIELARRARREMREPGSEIQGVRWLRPRREDGRLVYSVEIRDRSSARLDICGATAAHSWDGRCGNYSPAGPCWMHREPDAYRRAVARAYARDRRRAA